jgi:ABC-type transport system involved in multi-copper enzyme maturation permease subunit
MDCDSRLEGGREVVRTQAHGARADSPDVRDSGMDKVRKCRERVQRNREKFQNKVVKASPSISYRKFTATMLGTNYHESGYPPTPMESLNSAIGYLIFLISQTVLMFTASYGVFMRQDL